MEGESDSRPWDELVPDVLGLIFKNLQLWEVLQVIPMVCKSWCKALEGPYCWQRIDIGIKDWSWRHQQYNPAKLDRMLRTLITRSLGSLRELSVSYVNDDQMLFIAEHAGSLQTLTLRDSSISDSIVEKVATKFSSLTSLDLSYSDEVSTRALEAIGKSCEMLMSLTWKKHPPNLYEVLDEPYHAHGQSHADEARAIARSMPKLKHLCLSYLDIDTPVVLEILSGCPELETLDIQGCYGVGVKNYVEGTYPKIKVLGPAVLDEEPSYSSDYSYEADDGYPSDYSYEVYDDYNPSDQCGWSFNKRL